MSGAGETYSVTPGEEDAFVFFSSVPTHRRQRGVCAVVSTQAVMMASWLPCCICTLLNTQYRRCNCYEHFSLLVCAVFHDVCSLKDLHRFLCFAFVSRVYVS